MVEKHPRAGAVLPPSRRRQARGRDADAEIPEARRPAEPRAEMARSRGRASRPACRLPGMAGFAAGQPSGASTADTLQAICDLDLSDLESVEPPRGFGRDRRSVDGGDDPAQGRKQETGSLSGSEWLLSIQSLGIKGLGKSGRHASHPSEPFRWRTAEDSFGSQSAVRPMAAHSRSTSSCGRPLSGPIAGSRSKPAAGRGLLRR